MDDAGEWGVMHCVLPCRIESAPVNRISCAIWVTGSHVKITELEIMVSLPRLAVCSHFLRTETMCTAFHFALDSE